MMRIVLLLLVATLAGCAQDGVPEGSEGEDVSDRVTADTGCIRGVIVDETITPLPDAKVQILNTQHETVSSSEGTFSFCGLEPGTYFVVAQRPLYETVQTSAEAEAGVAQPPVLKIQMARIPGLVPFLETVDFRGFYECAFALFFITDSCDMAARTAHDEGVTVVPRHIQNNQNTAYAAFAPDIITVVQETWWDASSAATFRSSLQDTPIDNACDCSTKHMERKGEGGYIFDRMDQDALIDKNTGGSQSWPAMADLEEGQVAIRGFLPFQAGPTDVDYALDLEFQIITTFFHSYTPHPDWTFETKEQYPVPQ